MSEDGLTGGSALDETIDIELMLQALDRDLERRLSIAQRLEPILRDVVAYYGVPSDNWHSFGVVFRFDAADSGQTGMEIGGMGLRASGTRERAEGAPDTVHIESKRPDIV